MLGLIVKGIVGTAIVATGVIGTYYIVKSYKDERSQKQKTESPQETRRQA